MPINIPDNLPAKTTLEKEHIFVMTEEVAIHQDFRPLRIVILNLMPEKIVTETQLMRCLSNTPIQIEIDLLQTSSYTGKTTPREHLLSFYKTFEEIKNSRYDGMIITGAPVEHLPFEQVAYWDELKHIMDWSVTNVYSTFHICWGAQAGLYHHYGIQKYPLEQKRFGVYEHTVLDHDLPLFRGFDDIFYAPHSRHTEVRADDIENCPGLRLLSISPQAGVYIAASDDLRRIFVIGHAEYDAGSLANEYHRDIGRGLAIAVPENYFPADNPACPPLHSWRAHGALLYTNWLNYYVYQETPFDLINLENIDTEG